MNKYCNIEIKFSNVQEDKVYQLGEIVYGTIRIEPKLDFEIVELGYELQGLFNSDRIFSGKSSILEKCILLENCTLKKGEAISFDFAIKNDSLEDYEGRDFEFSSQFLVFIKMKKGSKLNSKNWIKTAVPIKFSGEGLGHEVVSSTVRLEMEEPMLVLGAIFFFLLFIWGQPGHPIILYPIAFVVFVALTLIGDQIYRTFFIGGIQAQFRTIDDENFEVKFFNNLDWKHARSMSVQYKVYESKLSSGEMGTDGGNYFNFIHTSEEVNVEQAANSASISFPFPKALPGTSRVHPSGIYYMVICKVKSRVGFGHTHKNYFEVSRRIPIK